MSSHRYEVEIITTGARFKPGAGAPVRYLATGSRLCSAAIAEHRFSENRELTFEVTAGVAKQQVQADQPALSRRQAPVLHLRDQPARVLARNKGAHD